MSGTELIVVIVGALLGYWIVSQFGARKSDPQQQQPGNRDPYDWLRRDSGQAGRKAEEQRPQTDASVPAWHETLQVAPDASIEEIRRAYRSLMSQYHPDKVASLGPELRELCERKTKEINTAYDRAMAERS
jgi:DnaJ like chaperone protein